MKWFVDRLQFVRDFVAIPQILTLILVIDVFAYFAGLLYWYGNVMASPHTPMWAWPFIPDCPLFGLASGMGLLMVTARAYWREESQVRAQRVLMIVAGVSILLTLSTYLPVAPRGWVEQRSMLAVWTLVLLLTGLLFRQAPNWLLGVFAFGAIKYGIWTVTAWLVFWRNTALIFGTPLFTSDSVLMTVTHLGLIAQGILLLSYFRPNLTAALVSFGWFALSDFMDYGLGFYPSLPLQFIPLAIMQWSTITVTFLLSGGYLWFGLTTRERSAGEEAQQGGVVRVVTR